MWSHRQAHLRGELLAGRSGAVGPPPPDLPDAVIFSQSLLERAGLEGRRSAKSKAPPARRDRDAPARYDITRDEPGKIRQHNRISDDPV